MQLQQLVTIVIGSLAVCTAFNPGAIAKGGLNAIKNGLSIAKTGVKSGGAFSKGLKLSAVVGIPVATVLVITYALDDEDDDEKADAAPYFPIRVRIGQSFQHEYKSQKQWKKILVDIKKEIGNVLIYCLIGEDFEVPFQATSKGVATLLLTAAQSDAAIFIDRCHS